ncbi:coiled-coil domain-containing protein [Streptosporangium sp. NPDC087985]|uniref:coiled-coil domain-containing protein n=1 Tax=Streptosporangium sp. NPDC087985 TaxID=3366196 RepID=UPI0037F6029A
MTAASRGIRRHGALRPLVAAFTAVILCACVASAGQASPTPGPEKLRKELAQLQKRSETMIAEYYAGRVELQKVEKTEKVARGNLKRAQQEFDKAATEIRLLAAEQYRTGGMNATFALVSVADPRALLSGLALTQQIMSEQDARLRVFMKVRDSRREAQKTAETRTAELRASLRKLDAQKRRAGKLIDQIKDKIDLLYPTPGLRRADGSWVPQLPSGPDNITPRMRLVRQLIAQRFGPRFGIGCYRSDGGISGGGEHPLGRACDFMLSSGGGFPSATETARGHEIVAWAIKNAQRLGIMYIIFRQRIWHVRTGTWRMMSDRGGTTANHFDHPHISVY